MIIGALLVYRSRRVAAEGRETPACTTRSTGYAHKSISSPSDRHRPARCKHGRIGITFCPGKVQPGAMSGSWNRDLSLDLDAIADWGAVAVVTLMEDHELATLQVTAMGKEVRARHMDWFHLPVPDVSIPDAAFEQHWAGVAPDLLNRLQAGFGVLVHCKGGLERASLYYTSMTASWWIIYYGRMLQRVIA